MKWIKRGSLTQPMLPILMVACVLVPHFASSQNTFYKSYASSGMFQCFDAIQTSDGGYLLTGIADKSPIQVPFLLKLDCRANPVWALSMGSSSTIGNVNLRVKEDRNGNYLLTTNVGVYNDYDALIVKTDPDGGILFSKLYKGSFNEQLNDIVQTSDGNYVLCGMTSSYGSDLGSPFYTDIYLVKIDSNGNHIWNKTIGNNSAIDGAYRIIEDKQHNLAMTGRYISWHEGFDAFLLRTDSLGNIISMKTYGDTFHRTYGYGIIETVDGFAICGSSTVLKTDHTSYADPFFIRTDQAGNVLQQKLYHATVADGSESASSIVETANGFALMNPTMSYATTGFVPNKFNLIEITDNGDLLHSYLYNRGSSHYAELHKTLDSGYLISGFSTLFDVATFQPLLIKTDKNFNSGCLFEDVSTQTVSADYPFVLRDAVYNLDDGFSSSDYSILDTFVFNLDTTLCENFLLLTADFSSSPACVGEEILFTNESSANAISFEYQFGDGAQSNASNPIHSYSLAGTYSVSLEVSDGCVTEMSNEDIIVFEAPQFDIPDDSFCLNDDQIEWITAPAAATEILWSDSSTGSSFSNYIAGLNWLQIEDSHGCSYSDSFVIYNNCLSLDTDIAIPNAFSPNGDGINDQWAPISLSLSLEWLHIYNRWGQLIFSAASSVAWDGFYQGEPQPLGTYVYHFSMRSADGTSIQKSGSLELIR